MMDVLWFGIILGIVSAAYAFGWQRGYEQGRQDGEEQGIKTGIALGEKIGLEKGVTERLLNSIKGSKGGVIEETEQKVRDKLYASLVNKTSPPPIAPHSGLDQSDAEPSAARWWLGACAVILVLGYVLV